MWFRRGGRARRNSRPEIEEPRRSSSSSDGEVDDSPAPSAAEPRDDFVPAQVYDIEFRSKRSDYTFPIKDELRKPCSGEVLIVTNIIKTSATELSTPLRHAILEQVKKQEREKKAKKQARHDTERYGWLLLTHFADIEDQLLRFGLSENSTEKNPLFKIKKTFAPAVIWIPPLQAHLPLALCNLVAEYGRNERGTFAVWIHGDRLVELLKDREFEITAEKQDSRLWLILSRLWRGDTIHSCLTALDQFTTCLPTPRWACISKTINQNSRKQRLPASALVQGLSAEEIQVSKDFDACFLEMMRKQEDEKVDEELPSQPPAMPRQNSLKNFEGLRGDGLRFDRPLPLRRGKAPFDYQMLNLSWMFDLERRIAIDDARAQRDGRRGVGARFDLECSDMLWRGHGFVYREGGGLVALPLLLDVHSFRMMLRPDALKPESPGDTRAFAPHEWSNEKTSTVLPTTAVSINRKHNDWLPPRELSTRGGILADEVGLGKTLTVLSLSMMHRRFLDRGADGHVIPVVENGLFRTGATLIMVPPHLFYQWLTEIEKFADLDSKQVIALVHDFSHSEDSSSSSSSSSSEVPPRRKTRKMAKEPAKKQSGKKHHPWERTYDSLTAQDVLEAHIILFTFEFLGSPEYNSQLTHGSCHPFDATVHYNGQHAMFHSAEEFARTRRPPLIHFHFQRILIDESHELFRPVSGASAVLTEARSRVFSLRSRFRFCLTATPFSDVHHRQTYNYTRFLELQLYGIPLQQVGVGFDAHYSALDLNSPSAPVSVQCIRDWLANVLENSLMRRNTQDSIGVEDFTPSFDVEIVNTMLTPVEQALARGFSLMDLEKSHAALSSPGSLSDSQVVDWALLCHSCITQLEEFQDEVAKELYGAERDLEKIELALRQKFGEMSVQDALFSQKRTQVFIHEKTQEMAKIKRSLAELKALANSSARPIKSTDKITPQVWDNPAFLSQLSLSAGSKIATASRVIAKIVYEEPKSKVVVFSAFPKTLQTIGSLLTRSQIRNEVCGTASRHQLALALSAFSNKAKDNAQDPLRVLLLQLADESAGANLLLATHIILIDTSTGPDSLVAALEKQAVGRALRQLMEHSPRVIKIVSQQETQGFLNDEDLVLE